jgi:hypothetical protein
MKKKVLFALLMAGCLTAGAQTAETKVKLSDSTQLVYAEASNGNKDGVYYVKNTKKDAVLMQGNYKNDKRIGTWYFFDANNKLIMRYNYDQKKLAYLDEAALKNVAVDIESDDPEVKKSASAPLPLCPIDLYTSYITKKLYAAGNGDNSELDAEIVAHVSADGTATYTVSYMGTNNRKVVNQKLSVPNDKFEIEWIPSKYKNQPIDSKFIVYTSVKANDKNTFRRNSWNN